VTTGEIQALLAKLAAIDGQECGCRVAELRAILEQLSATDCLCNEMLDWMGKEWHQRAMDDFWRDYRHLTRS
jgi:hypothetical protein